MHHDISTLTGEEAFVFSLREKPAYKANHNGKMRARITGFVSRKQPNLTLPPK
jgi:hypothetical protein